MCTVTYVPQEEGTPFVLTSNRDEKVYRPTQPPAGYKHGEQKIIYPRDEQAGGSWIAINEKGKLACLLNGAFVAHKKQKFHTISRGTILVDFTASERNSHEYFSDKDLTRVEPFTVVSMEHNSGNVQDFTEFIWDGQNKHFRQLDAKSPYIWSSATLYNEEHRNIRKDWFVRFFKENKGYMTPERIVGFHSGEHTANSSINVIMQRDGGLKTVSITQVTPDGKQLKMKYTDLVQQSLQEVSV